MADELVRRFPLPWCLGGNDACFWVEDAEGKRLAYVYFNDHPSISTASLNRLTRGEALRIARNVLKLPELLARMKSG